MDGIHHLTFKLQLHSCSANSKVSYAALLQGHTFSLTKNLQLLGLASCHPLHFANKQ